MYHTIHIVSNNNLRTIKVSRRSLLSAPIGCDKSRYTFGSFKSTPHIQYLTTLNTPLRTQSVTSIVRKYPWKYRILREVIHCAIGNAVEVH